MLNNSLNFPLDFIFKITTFSSDFTISDSQGNGLAYVRQKLFKLKEDVIIFNDESRTKEIFRIRANQWIDFNASYEIREIATSKKVGTLARKGMRSIWRATYNVLDHNDQSKYIISEKNAWIKILDGLVGEIPVLSLFTGYFFNPSYIVTDTQGASVFFELKKMPSLFGRKFRLEKINSLPDTDESLVVLSFLMMVLLERHKG